MPLSVLPRGRRVTAPRRRARRARRRRPVTRRPRRSTLSGTRIYLPSTLLELDSRHGLAPRLVHAVTPALRAALPDEDEEGLEYAAQLLAADDSLELLEGQAGARRRAGGRR